MCLIYVGGKISLGSEFYVIYVRENVSYDSFYMTYLREKISWDDLCA